MNRRLLITFISGAAVLLGGLAVLRQQRQVDRLHAELTRLQAIAATADTPARTAGPTGAAGAPSTRNLEDTRELMRLRAEVARLLKRQRDLAPLRVENERLRAAVTNLLAKDPGGRPAAGSWVRRREAQFVGSATPEAALQSFFWAIEQRNTNALFQLVTAEAHAFFQKALNPDESAEFWSEMGRVPGFRVAATETRSDTEVCLKVEVIPGEEPAEMTFTRSGGDWKLHP